MYEASTCTRQTYVYHILVCLYVCVCLRGTLCTNACLPAHMQARAGLLALVGVQERESVCACVCVCAAVVTDESMQQALACV